MPLGWFGLGRPRSKFGKWIDDRGITQQDLSNKSGVPRTTISNLAKDELKRPNWRTERKLMNTLREYDKELSSKDFWDF